MKQSLQYNVYKGTGGKFGAIQFSLQNPHYYRNAEKDYVGKDAMSPDGRLRDGWKIREGAVFVQITSAKDKNVYDWENKIIFALSVPDMGKVLLGLSKLGETSIMHDPNAKTEKAKQVQKYLKIVTSEKGALFSCTQSSNGENKTHSVPLSPDEVVTLRALLNRAVYKALNW